MSLLIAEQGSPEWHAEHLNRITSSNAAACLRLHPWMSASEGWRKSMGTAKDVDNYRIRWGIQYEDTAVAAYEIETGSLTVKTGLWVHDAHDWLGASPDRLVGSDGLAEVKVTQTLPTKIPPYHKIQCLVQLIVTGRDWCDYFAWNVDGHFLCRVYPQGEAGLIRRLRAFWEAYIKTGVEPPRKKPRRRRARCPLSN